MKQLAASLLIVSTLSASARAQTPPDFRQFHDRATAVIKQMATRPLTPGDTFLTWNPQPGGLIHTSHVGRDSTQLSLLRGDGMIGTATMEWRDNRPFSFSVQWTTRDSTTKTAKLDVTVHGSRRGDSLRVEGTRPATYAIPRGPWTVADFGMEDALIPLGKTLSQSVHQTVSVFRPWHGRWDRVTVSVHDTLGLRLIEVWSDTATHEVLFVKADRLLAIVRYDQPDERRPLEASALHSEYIALRSQLTALARLYAGHRR